MTTDRICNYSRVGDQVICNGYPGMVTRTKDSPGSSWMAGMVEVRLAAGLVCVADSPPDVIPAKERCPDCGAPVASIFDHVDRDCARG